MPRYVHLSIGAWVGKELTGTELTGPVPQRLQPDLYKCWMVFVIQVHRGVQHWWIYPSGKVT